MVSVIRSLIICTLVLAGILFFLGNGIQDTSIESFTITGISGVDNTGLDVNVRFTLNNPSNLPIPITDIMYNVTLQRTNQQIGSGDIASFTLSSGTSSTESVQRIQWVPTAQTALDLLTQEYVWMRIDGQLTMGLFGLQEITLPFSDRVDIREYIQQQAPVAASPEVQQVQDSVDSVVNTQSDSTRNTSELQDTVNQLI